MLLATLDELKTFLEKVDTQHDNLLESILTQVSARVESFLNRSLEKTARSLYADAGRSKYYLPAFPIDLSSTLSVVNDSTTQVINSDFYVWEDSGLIEFTQIPSYNRPKQLSFAWTGGYASVDVLPNDLHLAVILQSSFVFRRRKDIGVSSISLPDGSLSVNTPTELLPEVKSILKQFRRAPGGW